MEKILLLEDNLDILYANKECLELEGYEVLAGKSTCEGEEILHREKPELLVFDLAVPDPERMVFCQKLSRSVGFETVFLVPIGTEKKELELIKKSGFHYVLKPYLMETLINLIKSTLESKG